MGAYESNHRRFGFQAVWIWSSIMVQIQFQVDDQVDDPDFDVISIYFWKLIQRSKESIKRSKLSIKR